MTCPIHFALNCAPSHVCAYIHSKNILEVHNVSILFEVTFPLPHTIIFMSIVTYSPIARSTTSSWRTFLLLLVANIFIDVFVHPANIIFLLPCCCCCCCCFYWRLIINLNFQFYIFNTRAQTQAHRNTPSHTTEKSENSVHGTADKISRRRERTHRRNIALGWSVCRLLGQLVAR